MQKILVLVLVASTFFSCGKESKNMIYETKSGEYASKEGNFIAKFPTEPKHSIIDNKIGLDEFELNLFRSTLGVNKIFTIEYTDYPDYLLKGTSDEQLFSQGVQKTSNKIEESFNLEFQKDIEQHGLKGRYYVFKLKQSVIDKGVKGYFEGKMFRNGNRIYTITYTGHSDKNVDAFMNSFRLIKE